MFDLVRGYGVEVSTRTTATLVRGPRRRDAVLLVAAIIAGLAGGNFDGLDDMKHRVHLYVDDQGRAWRKGGWRSLLPKRFRWT